MKKSILLLFFLLKSISIYSQLAGDFIEKEDYVAISLVGPNEFFHPKTNGTLTVSFPYSSKDINGNVKNQMFNSSANSLFGKSTFKAGFLNAEFGNYRNFFTANITCIIGKNLTFDFILGYGLNFGFDNHLRFKRKKNNVTSKFVIKPCLGFGYSDYISGNIGSIDGKDKYINVFGSTSAPTFTTNPKLGLIDTRNTSSLDISYVQSNWSLVPKISIGFYPFKNPIFVDVYAAYFIPIYEIGHIQVEQSDGINETKLLTSEKLNTTNLSVDFNKIKSNSYSYKFGGLQVGINIGYNFGR